MCVPHIDIYTDYNSKQYINNTKPISNSILSQCAECGLLLRFFGYTPTYIQVHIVYECVVCRYC